MSFLCVQPVLILWFETHLASLVFGCSFRNIAVPVDFWVVGKLAQPVFPGGAVIVPFKPKS
jgi:hypothetical protein